MNIHTTSALFAHTARMNLNKTCNETRRKFISFSLLEMKSNVYSPSSISLHVCLSLIRMLKGNVSGFFPLQDAPQKMDDIERPTEILRNWGCLYTGASLQCMCSTHAG